MSVLHVWVGYDPREPWTYHTCVASLREKCPAGLHIHKLDATELRKRGLFSRPWEVTSEGQFIDKIDGKPFSTQFAYTRFLVPHLAREAGAQHALFMDCDFVALSDPTQVLGEIASAPAVHVVKHDFAEAGKKMDDMAQVPYERKLWSAFMVFDANNPYCRDLTPDVVNTESGAHLHRFKWVPDHFIGELAHGWQFLPGHSEQRYAGPIHMLHFTRGTPELPGYRRGPMVDVWYETLMRSLQHG